MTDDFPDHAKGALLDAIEYSLNERYCSDDKAQRLKEAREWIQGSQGPIEMDPKINTHEIYDHVIQGMPDNCPHCGTELNVLNGSFTMSAQFVRHEDGFIPDDGPWYDGIEHLVCNDCNEYIVKDDEPVVPKEYSQVPMKESRNDYTQEWERWDDCPGCGFNSPTITTENQVFHPDTEQERREILIQNYKHVRYIVCDSCAGILEDNTRTT